MIAIIKYNAGNIKSVQNALSRLGVESMVTDNKSDILNADKVIFPGVGEAGSAMTYLQDRGMDILIKSITRPFLGICLGQQLMCSHSEEGDTNCLNIFNVNVRKFPSTDIVPHMGWNTLYDLKGDIFTKITKMSILYIVIMLNYVKIPLPPVLIFYLLVQLYRKIISLPLSSILKNRLM